MADIVIHTFQMDGKDYVWADELFDALQGVANGDTITWSEVNQRSFNGRTAFECETEPLT